MAERTLVDLCASLRDGLLFFQHDVDSAAARVIVADMLLAAAEIERLTAERDEARAERDEATSWDETIERHGLDGFDALGDAWLLQEGIQRMHNAVSSVFSKWANDELMTRFRSHMTTIMHQSFVEGCLVGVKVEVGRSQRAIPEAARQMRDAAEKMSRERSALLRSGAAPTAGFTAVERDILVRQADSLADVIAALPLPEGGK